MKRKLACILVCAMLAVWLLPLGALADNQITQITLSGLSAPQIGGSPDYDVGVAGSGYSLRTGFDSAEINGVCWSRSDPADLSSATRLFPADNPVFQLGYVYNANITLVSQDGWVFADSGLSATVDGRSVSVSSPFNNGTAVSISYSYDLSKLNWVNITGLELPTDGAVPDFTVSASNGVQVRVQWMDLSIDTYMSGTDRFVKHTDDYGNENTYRLELTVIPPQGVSFADPLNGSVAGMDVGFWSNRDGTAFTELDFVPLAHTCSGGKATCQAKAKCSICGQEYGELGGHTPGPAATEKDPQKCTVCGYIIQPVLNHQHKLVKKAKVPATCTKEGTIEHYACNGCNKKFTDEAGAKEIPDTVGLQIAKLEHTPGSAYQKDGQQHWKECSVCKEKLDTEKHHLVEDKCSVCGYEKTVETESTETQTPTEPASDVTTEPRTEGTNGETGQQEGNVYGWTIAGTAGAVVVTGAATVTFYYFKKSKTK